MEWWNIYASYRTQCRVGDGPDRFLVPNEGKLEVMFALTLWCAKRQLDVGLWIYAVFATLKWRSPTEGHLFSEKIIEHYRVWEGTNRDLHHGAKLQTQLTTPDPKETEAGERVKQGFLARDRLELCMTSEALHGGFSMTSEMCRGCRLAPQCSVQR